MSVWASIFDGVAIVAGDKIKITNFLQRARVGLDLMANADLGCNVPAGGSETEGIDASATGDHKLYHYVPLVFNNTSDRWTGTASTLVARYRFYVRVSNSGISITPKIWYAADDATLISGPTVATISGQAACTATAADYSGTNQIQTVDVTIPTGSKVWAAGFTIGGTPAAGYQVWARAWRDIFISSTP